MDSTTNLTFDILGHIFDHYAKTESISRPLETLLLISRSWSDAALGHRALWSHLNIHIDVAGLYPSPRIWKARLPLRLKRCGDTVPLHIELRHLPSRLDPDPAGIGYWEQLHRMSQPRDCPARGRLYPLTSCACIRETRLCIDHFLLLLAGQGGELCKRWSTLYLDLHNPTDYRLEYKRLGSILRYPMPILTSLTIRAGDQDNGKGAFPHTPLLRCLDTVFTSSTSLPSLKFVRSLNIIRISHGEIYAIPDEVSNVEELELQGIFRLPNAMPNLWRLHLAGALDWSDNGAPQLPKLTHLALKNHGPHRFDALGLSRGLDLSRLVSFEVNIDIDYGNYSIFKPNVKEILRASTDLSTIRGNSRGIGMILDLLWEAEREWDEATRDKGQRERNGHRLLAGQNISIESEHACAVLSGDEKCPQLYTMAQELQIDLIYFGWVQPLDEEIYDWDLDV